MSESVDLATLGTGAVVAPAGHGKTYSIARTIENHPELRILVLTHTNAGIAALRRRVAPHGRNRPRIETISSFSLRLVRAFPGRAEWEEGDKPDLASLPSAGLRALKSRTVLDVVAMGFDLLIVDEFQDCSVEQAQTVEALAAVIPTVVLGDPLQAIFDFGTTSSASWDGSTEVLPLLATLTTPHRWKNTNPGLGEWLALARTDLLAGRRPTVASPHPLEIVSVGRDASQGGLSALIPRAGTTAIISPDHANINALPRIARSYKGRVRVAEKTDLSEARAIARTLDSSSDRSAVLVALIGFAAQTRTGVSTAVVQTLKRNLETKGVVSRSRQPVVLAAERYLSSGSAAAALDYFRRLIGGHEGYTYRPQLQKLFIHALSMKQGSPESSLEECAAQLIEQLNHRSSWEPYGTVVGTTLRLKGLEFDNVIVLNPRTITACNHLYVALSRPTKRLILATTD
ncbi:UvrD-helicase domain-containing protein [Arthrobacter sp. NPDC056886]|uniref:UvrD-helicase domain-containing protein n=1 Tax=Arthrobacter sp. NPDC056886 TaxID=3345960 RepID=UPI00366E2CF8